MRRWIGWKLVVLGAAATVGVGSVPGCAGSPHGEPVTHPRAERLQASGLAVEYMASIDRYTFFGPAEGPNLLHVVGVDREVAPDGAYTFFGGCYTWVSPQGGEAGWRDSSGALVPWPPDPAMDVGPAYRTGRTADSFTMRTPASRMGLVEEKTFRITGERTAELTYTLHNRGERTVLAGAWINTAVGPKDRLALRLGPGSEVWGWQGMEGAPLVRLGGEPDERGWVVIDPSRVDWRGGIKFYVSPGAGEDGQRRPEIAVWREGFWLHREQTARDESGYALLREHGEGPVATYLDRDGALFEAELYGPLAHVPPGGSRTATEVWRVIPSKMPTSAALP